MTCSTRPTPSFGPSPGPGGEHDSFGLQGGGSCLEQAGEPLWYFFWAGAEVIFGVIGTKTAVTDPP